MQSRGQIIGGSSLLLNEGGRRVLVPGMNDVVVIVQVKDSLQLIINGRDKHALTAAESRAFSVRGNTAKVYTDRSVTLPVAGLQGGSASHQAQPSASAKERLSLARQRSGALSAVVARQRVVQELLKDPFLVSISHLLLRLGRFFEVDLQAPRAPKAPSDLSRLFADAARALEFQILCKPLPSPAADLSADEVEELAAEKLDSLLTGVVLSLKRLVDDLRITGAQPDLNPLASQLLESLRRLVFESPSPPAVSAGKRPAESKMPVPGIDSKTMLLLCDSWNQALSEKEFPGLANLIQNEDSLSVLWLDEKIALLNRIMEMPDDPSWSSLLTRVLESAGSAGEFETMITSCNARLRSLSLDPGEAADLSIIAGAFGYPQYATDRQASDCAQAARGRGYSPHEIFTARAATSASRQHPDDLERIAQDPLKLLLSTITEKSNMLQALFKGQPSTRNARAGVSILLASANITEYETLAAAAGGLETAKKLKDPEAQRKWNLLAGAMGRSDMATDSAIAAIADKALLNPEILRKQQQDWESAVVASFGAAPPPSAAADPIKKMLQEKIAAAMNRLNSRVHSLDARSVAEGVLACSENRKSGKELLNPALFRYQAHEILLQQKPEKEKKKRMEELNRTAGSFTMRNIVYPLVFLYRAELKNIEMLGESIISLLEDQLAREALRNGADSSAVQRVQMKMDRAASVLDPVTYSLSRCIAILETIYPPPKEWYE